MPVKRRPDQIVMDKSGANTVSNQEPIKGGITTSTGSKGMMSLWSTNSDRKSYDIKHSISLKSEYNLDNLRDDPIFHEFEIIKDIG